MPTLPDSRDLRRVIPQNRSQIVQDRSGEIQARGFQQAADSLQNTVDGVIQRNDRFNYAAAKSTLLQADIEARKELEEDPDWSTHETRYREKLTKAKQAAAGVIKNPRDRALFEQDAGLDVERGTEAVRGNARRREVDWGRSVLEDRLDKNRTMAWEADDEATRQAAIANSEDLIAGAVEKGYLKQEEAGTVRRGFAEAYAKGAMNMMTPEEGLAALKDTKKGSVGYLVDAPTRALYKERWEKEIEMNQRAADQEQRSKIAQSRADYEWSQRQNADTAEKMLAAGKTVAEIQRESPNVWRGMDGHVQRALLADEEARVSGKSVETDWATYDALTSLPREELASTDLQPYYSKLAPAQRKELIDRKNKMANPENEPEVFSQEQQLSTMFDTLKLTGESNAEKRGKFKSAYGLMAAAEQKQLGRELNEAERQMLMDRLAIKGEVEKPGSLIDPDLQRYETYGTENAQYFVPEGYEDIPAAEKTKIEAALGRAGRMVTPASVSDMWARKTKK